MSRLPKHEADRKIALVNDWPPDFGGAGVQR